MKQSPILVCGAHRTGTTWAGKMLAAAPGVAYISEPLNVLHRPGVLRARVPYWYTYIDETNEDEALPAFREMLAFRYHLGAELLALRSLHDAGRMGRDLGIFLKGRLLRQRPLLKDPFAVFSTPWFASRLGCRVVVTVRHPAGFASSLKRLGWPFDFSDLLSQPRLMATGLEPYRGEMEAMLRAPEDILGQAALLWRLVYQKVAQDREKIPDLRVVRHEDLSLDPPGEFRKLYDWLGLEFTEKAAQTIEGASSSDNPKELRKTHSTRLDSRANLDSWKRRLGPEEIARIRELTAGVSEIFYAEETWP